MNLFREFQKAWADHRDATFLATDDATLSFAELDNRSMLLAGALRHGLGLAVGDIAIAIVDKSPWAVALYLACLRAGVVYLPANPGYSARELAHLLRDAAPRVVIANPQCAATAQASLPADSPVAAQVLTLDGNGEGTLAELARRSRGFDSVEMLGDEYPAALLYTSGTTGAPKGVPLSHRNLASNAQALRETWALNGDDVLVHALPLFHVHGLFVALNCALLARTAVRFLPVFEAQRVRDALRGASVIMGVPTYYARLLTLGGLERHHCATLRVAISGSASLSQTLFHAFEARTGQRILERYGMTETGMIASNPLHGERLAGTVGFALPGVELRVQGEQGEPVPTGGTGVVQVRGAGVFAGYLRRPEVNAREFTADGFFRTGDLGRLDANGRLTLLGRARDLIISGGYNLYPAEIEACVDAAPGVAESALIGVPDDDLGELAVAVVVPTDPEHPPHLDALQAHLGAHLARYKQPRRLEIVDQLPRNTMGKVMKQTLRERFADRRRQRHGER